MCPYWNPDINANINGFELLSKVEYRELFKKQVKTSGLPPLCFNFSLRPRIRAEYSLTHSWLCGWEGNGGGWHLTAVYDTILCRESAPSGEDGWQWMMGAE